MMCVLASLGRLIFRELTEKGLDWRLLRDSMLVEGAEQVERWHLHL